MGEAATVQKPQGRKQRKLRNLLLDRKFQLKYTGYLVAITLLLSVSLGVVLFRTSAEAIAQSEKSVAQGEQIVALGGEVVEESRKVSEVVRMNIVDDPVYQDNPELLDAFNQDNAEQDARLDTQRRQLEEQRETLAVQAERLKRFHSTLLWSLVGILAALVVAIGVAGIVVTHKVAGPIFKMQRHLKDVAAGKLSVPWGLRKGDELVDFFESFREMVSSLRKQRQEQIARVDEVMEALEGTGNDEQVAKLRALRGDLEAGLE